MPFFIPVITAVGTAAAATAGAVASAAGAVGGAMFGSGAAGTTAAAGSSSGLLTGTMAGLGATAAGIGAYSSIQQGKAAEAAAKHQSRLEQLQAEENRNKANFEARQTRIESRRIAAINQTSLAKNGVISTTGSPLLVMRESARNSELDARMISREGMTAYQSGMAGASITAAQGKAAKRAGYWNAGTTLLTGGSRLLGSIYGRNR